MKYLGYLGVLMLVLALLLAGVLVWFFGFQYHPLY